jgi:hypothetical protein
MSKGTTPEGRIKTVCLRYLEKRGITAWNNPTGAVEVRLGQWLHFGRKGSADILGCLPGGRFLAIEVKAPGGRLSPGQREFLETIKQQGGMAVVAKSYRDIEAALLEAGYSGIVTGPLFEGSNAAPYGGA